MRQIEELPITEADQHELIERSRALLDAHFERQVQEAAALAARGMRVDEALH